MISLLITVLIVFLVLGVAWWILTLIPLPPPFLTIAQVILALIGLLILINLLMGVGGLTSWHPLLR